MNAAQDGTEGGDRRQAERREQDRRGGGRPEGAFGRLAELRELTGYAIADGNPDIRGWEVQTAAAFGDRTVGWVEDLVVDLDTLGVRYMLVRLDKDAVATTRDRRILVPVGIGRLDERHDQVRLDGFTSAQLVAIPEFRPGKLTRHYETTVHRRFSPPAESRPWGRRSQVSFYDRREFDDRHFWGARRVGRENAAYLIRDG